MATRGLLVALAAAWDGNAAVRSVGGVEAARLVREGEPVDVVVLAASAMETLEADGFVLPGSLGAVAVSSMVAAVRKGDALPSMTAPEGIRHALLTARHVGYSTGPSGEHLLRLIDAWGIRDALQGRLVQAPPGLPVSRLLLEGKADLGFQQRSELLNVEGVVIAGPLPPPIAADTVFTAGIARGSTRRGEAGRFVRFVCSTGTEAVKLHHGLQPA